MSSNAGRQLIRAGLDRIKKRARPDGAFSLTRAGQARPDATAWAVLVLAAADRTDPLIDTARRALIRFQQPDGRVILDPAWPAAYWPTPLACLAWTGDEKYDSHRSRAIKFLLSAKGLAWPRRLSPVLGHDTSIVGWPWVDQTHSWTEPTGLALLALAASGQGEHPRCREGIRLLLDRQLPHGGWNYGNTRVFKNTLPPMPKSTGLVLDALARRVAPEKVAPSLAYARTQVAESKTPLSLGWLVLGLSAWDRRPDRAPELVAETLQRQKTVGAYDTVALAVLILAGLNQDGRLVKPAGGDRS